MPALGTIPARNLLSGLNWNGDEELTVYLAKDSFVSLTRSRR